MRRRSLLVLLAVETTVVPKAQQQTAEALPMNTVPGADLDTRCNFPSPVPNIQVGWRARKLKLYSARVWEHGSSNCRSESPASPLFSCLQLTVSVVDTHVLNTL